MAHLRGRSDMSTASQDTTFSEAIGRLDGPTFALDENRATSNARKSSESPANDSSVSENWSRCNSNAQLNAFLVSMVVARFAHRYNGEAENAGNVIETVDTRSPLRELRQRWKQVRR